MILWIDRPLFVEKRSAGRLDWEYLPRNALLDGTPPARKSFVMDRFALQCPECGASLPPEAAHSAVRCAQCNTTSAPRPREAAPVRVVVEHVVRSGDDVVPVAPPVAPTPPCPRCGVPLHVGTAEGIAIAGCGVCGGVWANNAAARAVTELRAKGVVALSDRAAAYRQVVLPASSTAPPVACPVCGEATERVLAAEVAWVDACNEHGTWFDAKELRRIYDVLREAASIRNASRLEAAAVRKYEETTPEIDGAFGRGAAMTAHALFVSLAKSSRK